MGREAGEQSAEAGQSSARGLPPVVPAAGPPPPRRAFALAQHQPSRSPCAAETIPKAPQAGCTSPCAAQATQQRDARRMCQQSGRQPTTTASGVGAWCYWLLQSIPISVENELPAHRCARVWSCVGAGGVATNGRPWGDVSGRGTTWECVAYRCPLAITIGILGAAAGAALSILRCMRDRAPSISLPVGVASQRKHMQRWPADRATQLRHADMSSSPRRRRLRLACHLMPCPPTTTRGLARRGTVFHTAQWLTYRHARRLSEVGSVQTAAAQRVLLSAGAQPAMLGIPRPTP